MEEIGNLSGNSLYGIVNVAGISVGKSIVGMNDDDWDKMIEVNLTSSIVDLKTTRFYDGWRKNSQRQFSRLSYWVK